MQGPLPPPWHKVASHGVAVGAADGVAVGSADGSEVGTAVGT